MDNLPEFRDQGMHSRTLLLGIQALIPEYHFTCHGRITRWGIATEKRGGHRIDLQVWRPLDQTEGSYALIGANSFTVQPEKGQKLLYLTPNATELINVQPGDVVGLFMEDNVQIDDGYLVQTVPDASGVTVQFVHTDRPLNRIAANQLPVRHSIAPVLTLEMGKQQHGHMHVHMYQYYTM